jgi:hypothetical protein
MGDERFCQYAAGICHHQQNHQLPNSLFFGYPSAPEASADAIHSAIDLLKKDPTLGVTPVDWQELPVEGNLIFCEICKSIRSCSCSVLNVTNANFNVLFEYGFALGAGCALWPLVEDGLGQDDRMYTQLETMTTVGYSRFTNGKSIHRNSRKAALDASLTIRVAPVLGDGPTREAIGVLYLKSPQYNEPSLRVTERLSLFETEVITDDPSEVAFRALLVPSEPPQSVRGCGSPRE